jgi:uncharacterized protein YcbK (DUF882 family)
MTTSFVDEEFECHDGTDVPSHLMANLQRLCDVLQAIRNEVGVPLNIISGYRTPGYNQRIQGAIDSAHMTAEAADVRPGRGVSPQELHDTVLEMYRKKKLPGLGGLGIYRTWVHIDVRKAADGHLRRWSGKGVGSERQE